MQSGTKRTYPLPCRYSVSQAGEVLLQELRCASDSYRIDVNSTSQSDGGSLSGTWTGTDAQRDRRLSGRAAEAAIQARVTALEILRRSEMCCLRQSGSCRCAAQLLQKHLTGLAHGVARAWQRIRSLVPLCYLLCRSRSTLQRALQMGLRRVGHD